MGAIQGGGSKQRDGIPYMNVVCMSIVEGDYSVGG